MGRFDSNTPLRERIAQIRAGRGSGTGSLREQIATIRRRRGLAVEPSHEEGEGFAPPGWETDPTGPPNPEQIRQQRLATLRETGSPVSEQEQEGNAALARHRMGVAPTAIAPAGFPTGQPIPEIKGRPLAPQTPAQIPGFLRRVATEPGAAGNILTGLGAGEAGYVASGADVLASVGGAISDAGERITGRKNIGGKASADLHAWADQLRADLESMPEMQTAGGTFGRVGFDAVPSAIAMTVPGAAPAAIGAMMLASGGQGIAEYRAIKQGVGEKPDPYSELAIGAGYATAEYFFERIGISRSGRAIKRTADAIAEGIAGRNVAKVATVLTHLTELAGVNYTEEAATQVAQNLIDMTYDPEQTLGEGVGEAGTAGAMQALLLGGAGLGGEGVKRLRRARAARRSAPGTPGVRIRPEPSPEAPQPDRPAAVPTPRSRPESGPAPSPATVAAPEPTPQDRPPAAEGQPAPSVPSPESVRADAMLDRLSRGEDLSEQESGELRRLMGEESPIAGGGVEVHRGGVGQAAGEGVGDLGGAADELEERGPVGRVRDADDVVSPKVAESAAVPPQDGGEVEHELPVVLGSGVQGTSVAKGEARGVLDQGDVPGGVQEEAPQAAPAVPRGIKIGDTVKISGLFHRLDRTREGDGVRYELFSQKSKKGNVRARMLARDIRTNTVLWTREYGSIDAANIGLRGVVEQEAESRRRLSSAPQKPALSRTQDRRVAAIDKEIKLLHQGSDAAYDMGPESVRRLEGKLDKLYKERAAIVAATQKPPLGPLTVTGVFSGRKTVIPETPRPALSKTQARRVEAIDKELAGLGAAEGMIGDNAKSIGPLLDRMRQLRTERDAITRPDQGQTVKDLERRSEAALAAGGTSISLLRKGHQLMPAFRDTTSGQVYPSRMRMDGENLEQAPIHSWEGLPESVVLERDSAGLPVRVKASIEDGFVDEAGKFYTRDEAAELAAGPTALSQSERGTPSVSRRESATGRPAQTSPTEGPASEAGIQPPLEPTQTSERAPASVLTRRQTSPSTSTGPISTVPGSSSDQRLTERLGTLHPSGAAKYMQRTDSIPQLVAWSRRQISHVAQVFEGIAGHLGAPWFKPPRIKSAESIARKVRKLESTGRDPSTFSDILGGRLAIRNDAQAQDIIDELGRLGYRVFDDENTLKNPKPAYNGYRARHVQVDFGDLTVELELVPRQLFEIQERGHLYFDVTRVLHEKGRRNEATNAELDRLEVLTKIAHNLNTDAYWAYVTEQDIEKPDLDAILAQFSRDELQIIAHAKGIDRNLPDAEIRARVRAHVLASEAANVRKPRALLPPGPSDRTGRPGGDVESGDERSGLTDVAPPGRPVRGKRASRGPRAGRGGAGGVRDGGVPAPETASGGQPGVRGGGATGGTQGTLGVDAVQGPGPGAAGDGAGGGATDGRGGSEAGVPPPREEPRESEFADPASLPAEERNHVIAPGEGSAPGGFRAKFDNNIAALELLNTLERDGRNATPEEKAVLAKYSGWGWFGQAFDESNPKHAKERAKLRELMSEAEYASARESTQNAHYTSEDVVRPMWDLAKRLGFKGGRVLEPGAGVGAFLGMMPQDLGALTGFVAIDLDTLSGRFLRKLYPQADVRIQGFETAQLANNSFDMAIGNVPFSGIVKPAGRDYNDLLLHDYFFARAMDKVKPGGLVVFITSDGTLNKVRDGKRVRSLFAEKADLVGAIRLPNNAFKANAGTEVTTDIIVFRKKDGTAFAGEGFLNVEQVGTAQYKDRDGVLVDGPILVNEYFARHPDMALGKHSLEGTQYSAGDYALVPKSGMSLEKALPEAIARLPENVIGTQERERDFGFLPAQQGQRPGSYVEQDGNYFLVTPDGLKPADWLNEKLSGKDWGAGIGVEERHKRIEIAGRWMPIRAAMWELLNAEKKPETTDKELKVLRGKLGDLHDAFVKAHGTLNRTQEHHEPAHFLRSDPDYYLIQTLERQTEKVHQFKSGKRAGESEVRIVFVKNPDVFTKRMRKPDAPPKIAKSAADAIAMSMGYRNRIDVEWIAELLRLPVDQARDAVLETGQAFEDPEQGTLIPSARYLSGNVRKKLAAAKAAAEGNRLYEGNVKALEAVQPADVSITDIAIDLSARWLPNAVTSAFATERFGVPVTTRYLQEANHYSVREGGRPGVEVEQRYGVSDEAGDLRMTPAELLKHGLEGTTPTVYDSVYDPDTRRNKQVANSALTSLAETRLENLNQAFRTWVKTTDAKVTVDGLDVDVQVATRRRYNDVNNSVVPPNYDGSYLVLPGMSATVRRLPHRLSVIARILQEGAAVMAHGVGSGKTFSQIVAAMELRRLGLAKKPMIVVQKATVGQFARSFREAYPDARILVATQKTFQARNRRRLMANVTTGDWDAVIVTQPQFDRIPIDPERAQAYIEAKIADYLDLIDELVKEEGKRSPTVKQIEAQVKALRNKLQKMIDEAEKISDATMFWEEMGIDFLMLDEVHAYKNAPIFTNKKRVKGIPSGFSDRALTADIKVKSIQEKKGGRGVVGASGTPIVNTMAEAYVMLQLNTPAVLAEYNIRNFDDFANTFGRTETAVEYVNGRYKSVTRFRRLVNGPELVRLIRAGFDVKMGNKELGLDVPDIEGGKEQLELVPWTPAFESVQNDILSVIDTWEAQDPKDKRETSWVPITVMSAGVRAAADPRLINPDAPDDPNSKISRVAQRVAERWKEWDAKRGTQIVFLDNFRPMNMEKLQAFMRGGAHDPHAHVQVDDQDDGDDILDALRDDQDPDAGDVGESAESKAETVEHKKAGFNLYRDLRDKLVALGVPAEHIAIIHDYETDKARERLFDRMNAGEVRVLLASTEKGGVGVNIQRRLVGLWQVDPPRSMTPANRDQRIGRGVRQGNIFSTKEFDGEKNPEYIEGFTLRLRAFGVENSADTGIYQLMENKQKFIVQFLMGQGVGREFDDPADEGLAVLAELKAKMTGDTRVLRLVELKAILDKLRRERDAHENEIAGRKEAIAREYRDAEWHRTVARERVMQAKELAPLVADDVEASIRGQTVKGLEEVKKALKPIWEEMHSIRATDKNLKRSATFRLAGRKVDVEGYLKLTRGVFEGDASKAEETRTVTVTISLPSGTMSGKAFQVGTLFKDFQDRIDEAPTDIARSRERADEHTAKAKALEATPLEGFTKQTELEKAEQELRDIEDSLVGKKKATKGAVVRPGEGEGRAVGRSGPSLPDVFPFPMVRFNRRRAGAVLNPIDDIIRVAGRVAERVKSVGAKGLEEFNKSLKDAVQDLAGDMPAETHGAVGRFAREIVGRTKRGETVQEATERVRGSEMAKKLAASSQSVAGALRALREASEVGPPPEATVRLVDDLVKEQGSLVGSLASEPASESAILALAKELEDVRIDLLASKDAAVQRERLKAQRRVKAQRQADVAERKEQVLRAREAARAQRKARRIVSQIAALVPGEIRGKLLTDVRDARGYTDVVAAIGKARGVLAVYIGRKAGKTIDKLTRPRFLKRLDEATRGKLNEIAVQEHGKIIGGKAFDPLRQVKAPLGVEAHAQAAEVLANLADQARAAVHEFKIQSKLIREGRYWDAVISRGKVQDGLKNQRQLRDMPRGRPGKSQPRWYTRWRRWHWNAWTFAMRIGGRSGEVWRLFKDIRRGENVHFEVREAALKDANAAAKRAGFRDMMHVMTLASGLLGDASVKTKKVRVGKREYALNYGQLAKFYAYFTDPQTMEALRFGNPINFGTAEFEQPIVLSGQDVTAITDAVPDEIRQLVMDLKAVRDRTFPLVQRIIRWLKGYEPPKVPFYEPRSRNVELAAGVEERDPFTVQQTNRLIENAGFTIQRVKDYKTPILVGDFFMDWLRTVDGQARIIGLAVPIRNARVVLLAPEVKQSIAVVLGDKTIDRMAKILADAAGMGEPGKDAVRWAQWLTRNVSRGITQGSLRSWLINMASVPRAVAEVPVQDGVVALAGVHSLETNRQMLRESVWARRRYAGSTTALTTSISDRLTEAVGTGGTIKALARNALVAGGAAARSLAHGDVKDALTKSLPRLFDMYRVMLWFDATAARVLWRASLREAKRLGESREWAIANFEERASRVLPSSDGLDIAGFAADLRNTLAVVLTSFTSDAAIAYNQIEQGYMESTAKGLKVTTGWVAGALMAAATVWGLESMWGALFGGDDDDEVQRRALEKAALRFVQETVGVQFLANRGIDLVAGAVRYNRVDFADAPLFTVINRTVVDSTKLASDLATALAGEDQAKVRKAEDRLLDDLLGVAEGASSVAGAPTTPIIRTLRRAARGE